VEESDGLVRRIEWCVGRTRDMRPLALDSGHSDGFMRHLPALLQFDRRLDNVISTREVSS
jgi:hypothetical protein